MLNKQVIVKLHFRQHASQHLKHIPQYVFQGKMISNISYIILSYPLGNRF